MQDVIPYSTDGGIAKLSCNGVSLTRNGSWLLPIWREIGGGQPCQSVPKSAKALHGVAGVLLSHDQVHLPLALVHICTDLTHILPTHCMPLSPISNSVKSSRGRHFIL